MGILAAGIAGTHYAAICAVGAPLIADLGQLAGAPDTKINRLVVLARRHAALYPVGRVMAEYGGVMQRIAARRALAGQSPQTVCANHSGPGSNSQWVESLYHTLLLRRKTAYAAKSPATTPTCFRRIQGLNTVSHTRRAKSATTRFKADQLPSSLLVRVDE